MRGRLHTHLGFALAGLLLLRLGAPAWAAQDATARKPVPGPGTADVVRAVVEVRLPDGRPFPGAEVQVFSRYENTDIVRSRRETGPDGRISPVELWPGTMIMSIYVRPTVETAPLLVKVDQVLNRGESLERSVQVEAASQVQGQVLDEQGAPVAGVRVQGWARDRAKIEVHPVPEADVYTTSREDGSFLLGGLPHGPFTLDVVAEGKTTVRRAGGFLALGQRVEGVLLHLAPAHELTGQVLGADGAAVAGAGVHAGRPWRMQRPQDSGIERVWYYPAASRRALSDGDGLFALPGVPDDERWNLEVKGPGHLPYQGRLEPGQTFVEVRLEAGCGLRGVIEDPTGNPLAGASVLLRGSGKRRKESDADGAFRFEGLDPAGTYFVLVHKPGSGARTLGPLLPEPALDAVRAVLEPGRPLAGVVVDAAGAALSGVTLTLEPLLEPALAEALRLANVPTAEAEFGLNRGATTAEGSFRFHDLQPGRYRLIAVAGNGQRLEQELESGAEDLRLVIGGL